MAKKYTKIAIAYDFDGTLAPGNMQEHSFIPKLGINKSAFWSEVKEKAEKHDMNEILAYMHLMLKKANEKQIQITQKAFEDYGKGIIFFKGVEEYFGKMNAYAKTKGLEIEHYIISSGLRDILKGTKIHKNFEAVYASAYEFDINGVAVWPALAVDYTNKTQFLFRINKGIKNSWDNSKINKYVKEEERSMPFSRMIYIGDGETDIPAMKMINYQNGISIAVYNPNIRAKKGKPSPKQICQELLVHKRATYIAPADYSEGGELYNLLTSIIDKIALELELKKYMQS
jgi:2-hydroxy-3-keto-5-methylthiopentenyl-1-phosphate phosphatase